MKKYLLLLILLGIGITLVHAQVSTGTNNFRNVQAYVEKQEIVIELKALIPASDEFREKTDTYQKAGAYNFTFDKESMRENSEILLNKWLKESK